jgi:hypothetical protein
LLGADLPASIRMEAEIDTVLRMTMLEMLQDSAIKELVVNAAVRKVVKLHKTARSSPSRVCPIYRSKY